MNEVPKTVGYPDFFVVGAQKSATTTLYQALSQHPAVFVPPIKEPNYFCSDISRQVLKLSATVKSRFSVVENKKQLESLLKCDVLTAHVLREDLYLDLFMAAKPGMLKGDFSVNYLYSEKAAAEIKKVCPTARIIAVLRNPVDRAYSQYAMSVMMGVENRDFSTAIREEMTEDSPMVNINSNGYLERGLYCKQLKRYFDEFPKEQILVIRFEDLIGKNQDTMSAICTFLGIPKIDFHITHEFAGKEARFARINFLLTRYSIKRFFGNWFPRKFKDKLKESYYISGVKQKMLDGDRNILCDWFREDVFELEKLLGHSYSSWSACENSSRHSQR
ncbi:sulfotransferase family protein [Gallionella capsiferriformans]|uniref:Sulfotransferase n=1 Tax=Gallionella capsiferriformans (strain ES-2) TaxID=395494 RepID=D9SFL5_GALCS|nr:sulfotransferase [Gallionella capsiferriformans]ADL55312.1 sulfotransferase [Gallionella capsiferriformans ES-2]